MKYNLLLKQEAVADIQQAYEYYEEHLERITKTPLHFPVKRKPYHEIVVKIFPYVIIYEIENNTIIVYAIFNTWKNPKKKPKNH